MTLLLNSRVNVSLLKDTLQKNRNILLILTLVLGLTFPIPALIELYYSESWMSGQQVDLSIILILFIATAAILTLIPFLFFNYLTKKRAVDFMHSLPISRSELFLTYSAASFLIVFIPFTIVYWSGFAVMYQGYGQLFDWLHLTIYLRAILMFAAIQIPALFVIMNTGTLFDSFIFTSILVIAPFIAYFAIEGFTSTYLLGFKSLSTNILLYISPITFFISAFNPNAMSVNYNLLSLYWFVFSIIGYIVCAMAYRHWKSEFAERPFNNDYFYPFVTSLFTSLLYIFTLSAFSLDTTAPLRFLSLQNIVFPTIFTYVFFVLLDFIKQRTTKFFFNASKHFTYIVIFSLSLATIIFTTQGFGYAWVVPDAKEVDKITISVKMYDYKNRDYSLNITDKDEINIIVDMHQEMVNYFKEHNKFFNDTTIDSQIISSTVDFRYTLNDGDHLNRSFKLDAAMTQLLLYLDEMKSIAILTNPILSLKPVLNPIAYNLQESSQLDLNRELSLELASVYLDELTSATTLPLQDEPKLEYYLQYQVNSDETENYEDYLNIEDIMTLMIDSRFPKTIELLQSQEFTKNDLEYYTFENTFDQKQHVYGETWSWFIYNHGMYPLKETELKNKLNNSFKYSSTKQITKYIAAFNDKATDDLAYLIPIFE